MLVGKSHHSPTAAAGNDLAAAYGCGSNQKFGRRPGLPIAVGQDELAGQTFEDGDVSDRADFECAQFVGLVQNLSRSRGRHFDDAFKRQAERQELAHGGRHVVDRAVDVHRVKVGADRGGLEAIVEGCLCNVPVETAEPVTNVKITPRSAAARTASKIFPLASVMGLLLARKQ